MFLLRWYKEYLDIKHEHSLNSKEEKSCESCETLKMQLSIANENNNRLLARLIEKPEPEIRTVTTAQDKPLQRGPIPWNVKRQMLEAEDREKAKLMRQVAKPVSTEDLEKELDIAGKERETQTGA